MINDNFIYFTAFLIGIAGSTHCIGMCSSIIIILSINVKDINKKIYFITCYNVGRIFSYSIIGLIGGIFGTTVFNLSNNFILASIIKLFSGTIITLLGLYLLGLSNKFLFIEKSLSKIFYNLTPLYKKIIPIKTYWKALLIGLLWGYIPCGLVYSVFIWALSSGNIIKSCLLMTFFGLGTLPSIISIGYSQFFIKKINNYKIIKNIINILIISFGIFTILTAFSKCHHLQ